MNKKNYYAEIFRSLTIEKIKEYFESGQTRSILWHMHQISKKGFEDYIEEVKQAQKRKLISHIDEVKQELTRGNPRLAPLVKSKITRSKAIMKEVLAEEIKFIKRINEFMESDDFANLDSLQ